MSRITLILILLRSLLVSGVIRTHGFIRTGIVDVVFTDSLLFVNNTTRSLLECSSDCLSSHGCLSFTFTSSVMGVTSCRGHTSLMTVGDVSEPALGSRLFHSVPWVNETCTSDSDCPAENSECFAGKCVCTPGYYYSLSRRICTVGCNEADLQTKYLPYPGRGIISNNLECLVPATLQTCLNACNAKSACRTVDYSASSENCCLQPVTALDVPEAWSVTTSNVQTWSDGSSTSAHYQRCCV